MHINFYVYYVHGIFTGYRIDTLKDYYFFQNDHLLKPHKPAEPFDFNYAVKDDQFGTDFSHNAINDGDTTQGEYKIQLPDGRTQIVKYTANWATGFHAQVNFFLKLNLLKKLGALCVHKPDYSILPRIRY